MLKLVSGLKRYKKKCGVSLMDDDYKCHVDKILKMMSKELDAMKADHEDPEQLDNFYELYQRFLTTRRNKIDWEKIKPPQGKIVNYETLKISEDDSKNISKLAVLKLNGGLGTTMGCVGPKSVIKVRDNMNFIDLIAKQIKHLNKKYSCEVPLVLMNSFNTDERTKKLTRHYDFIKTFNQSKFPRISAENFMPINENVFYPPGHGDLLYSLNKSGMLDELLSEGKEYVFISNVDNLGATVDLTILNHIVENNIDFCMEVTNKTRADIKGGTLVNYNDNLMLLEIAQVPPCKKSEFTSVRKFKIFNTNSIWINLKVLKQIAESKVELDIIQNNKNINNEKVIQLETALGASIKYFENNCGIVVPRSRFLPVKTCSDLFLLQSNLYTEKYGSLCISKERISQASPTIKLLGKNFCTVEDFENSFSNAPDILDLETLTVSGNVTFGKNVVLRGIVIICATDGNEINIPEGSVLDDKIILGNLPITDV
ncbi:UTP--glucose-1-phosphate uridylyltransferase [Enteropsectra breve]|nr:UTP--glucose-1-phosphate uridylyltransferase [Enteropsectra breve]